MIVLDITNVNGKEETDFLSMVLDDSNPGVYYKPANGPLQYRHVGNATFILLADFVFHSGRTELEVLVKSQLKEKKWEDRTAQRVRNVVAL